MENQISLKIDLPNEVIAKIERVIIDTLAKVLYCHATEIKSEPRMVTRKEAASILRVTLPTLRQYELIGRLIPKRSGRKVLYTKSAIDGYIASLRS